MSDSPAATSVQETGSALDALRAEFQKKVEEPRLFKRFPSAEGKLVGEYKVPKKKDARAAAVKEDDEALLSACLVAIHVDDPGSPQADSRGLVLFGEWIGKPNEDPYRFDHRLCDALGIDKGTPSEIALALFYGNDLALAQQVGELSEWGLDTTSTAFGDFFPASPTAQR